MTVLLVKMTLLQEFVMSRIRDTFRREELYFQQVTLHTTIVWRYILRKMFPKKWLWPLKIPMFTPNLAHILCGHCSKTKFMKTTWQLLLNWVLNYRLMQGVCKSITSCCQPCMENNNEGIISWTYGL